MKKIPSSFFLLLVFYFLWSHVLWAQETKATNLELEAESYEERGYFKKAEELRSKVKRLREDQFRERNRGPNFPITSDIPATSNGSLVFNQGNWEVGFRGLSQFGVFTSGDESALDDGRIAFQAGSPYYPRSPIGYQNIRSLPFTYDIKNPYEISRSFSPRFAYKHKSAKWGLEYTFLQFQTTNDYLSFGFATVPLSALHSDRLYSAEHNLVVKIYEEYSKNIGYSWDFGLRAGSFHTNSVFSSQSLRQTGVMRDSIQYLAPSVGFRFYHKLGEGLSYDLGGALFVTPLGKLMYRRDVLTQAGGSRRFGEGMIVSDEAYSLFSEKPIQTSITGIDLLGQFNWQPFEHHKFHLGLQIIQYIWRANESYAPGIRALNEESFYSGVRDYYLSSAFYEADGQNKRSSRNYLVSNLYFGYTYVF